MKRYTFKLGLFVLASLFLFNACTEDLLNEDPGNSVPVETAITNEQSLDNAVLGIYSSMASARSFGVNLININALVGDNGFISVNNSNRGLDLYNGSYAIAENAMVGNTWNGLYKNISRANNVLSYVGNIVEDQRVEGTVNQKFAEAHTARAYSLFQLVNLFSRAYGTFDQDKGIVVPLSFEPGAELPRTSVDAAYGQIISDLQTAINLFEGYNGPKQRLGSDAAKLLLSRVYLYKKDYQASLDLSNQLLEDNTLLAMGQVESYHNELENQEETLFEVDFTQTNNLGHNTALAGVWGSSSVYKQDFLTNEFYDLIPASDVRKSLYTIVNDYPDNPKPINTQKFNSLSRNVVYLRKTEALFNKVEALYFVNPAEAKTQLVEYMVNYRDPAYAFTGEGQALLDEILKQRRIEFVLEGQRLFDLNRYQLNVQKGANCNAACDVPYTSVTRIFPIPLSEMRSNLSMVQNPGY